LNSTEIVGHFRRTAFTFHDIPPKSCRRPIAANLYARARHEWVVGTGTPSRTFKEIVARLLPRPNQYQSPKPPARFGLPRLVQAPPRRDQLRLCLRCRFAVRCGVVADNWRSVNSAHRTHLAAKPSHVALLSGDRVNLDIARHSAANFRKLSEGFIGLVLPLCRIPDISNLKRP
jgi:hypothetical protein